MRICVIGSGAIGGYYGTKLQLAGHSVTYLVRPETKKVLEHQGITIHEADATHHLNVHAVSDLIDEAPFQVTLVAVKSFVNHAILSDVLHLVAQGSYLLCLQNGISNERYFAQYVDPQKVIPCAAYISADSPEKGVIQHGGLGQIVIGSFKKENKVNIVNQLADVFESSGVPCKVSEDVMQDKWNKLCWNISFNPLTALTGATVGEVFGNQQLYDLMTRILQEFCQVADREGFPIPEKTTNRILEQNRVPNHKTSMLQDREKGKQMEVNAIIGDIVSIAKQNNIDVPVMETIYQTITFISKKETASIS